MIGVMDRNPCSSLITRGHKIHNVGVCDQILFHMAIDHYISTDDVLHTLLLYGGRGRERERESHLSGMKCVVHYGRLFLKNIARNEARE